MGRCWHANRGTMTVCDIDRRPGGRENLVKVDSTRDLIIASGMEDGLRDALELLEQTAQTLR